jgi:ABC-type molybdate transport system substrate-binding protein
MKPRTLRARTVLALAAAWLAVGCGPDAQAVTAEEPLLIAGAADLRPAFTVLGERFEEATGERVVFSFGSSGQLAQQLIEGAPMDLYASANVSFVEQVLDAGVGDPDTQATYAFGRITIWSLEDAWRGWASLDDLAADEEVRTIAIANPDHAPYGLAARQALEAAGLWGRSNPGWSTARTSPTPSAWRRRATPTSPSSRSPWRSRQTRPARGRGCSSTMPCTSPCSRTWSSPPAIPTVPRSPDGSSITSTPRRAAR